jgi:hypothetical protein
MYFDPYHHYLSSVYSTLVHLVLCQPNFSVPIAILFLIRLNFGSTATPPRPTATPLTNYKVVTTVDRKPQS